MSVNPVWPFTKQVAKYGYVNNPFWTTDATPTHHPCGYWHGGGDLIPPAQKSGILRGFVNSMGFNSRYQLGFGDDLQGHTLITQVPDLGAVFKIAVGYLRSFVIDDSYCLWVVGDNSQGALGISSPNPIQNWTKVPGKWQDIASSDQYNFTLGIKFDGTLWVVGENGNGQLGLGDTTDRTEFTPVGSDNGWTRVFCGTTAAFAMQGSTLYASGISYTGYVGQQEEFTTVLTDVTEFSSGPCFSLATRGGILYVVGENRAGQLGMGDTTARSYWEISTTAPEHIELVNAGIGGGSLDGTSLIIDQNKDLYMAGYNGDHTGGLADTSDHDTFTLVTSDVTHASGGLRLSLIIKDNKTLWGVGKNTYGELGFGNLDAVTEFTQVDGREWLDVQTGYGGHTLANNWDGKFYWE